MKNIKQLLYKIIFVYSIVILSFGFCNSAHASSITNFNNVDISSSGVISPFSLSCAGTNATAILLHGTSPFYYSVDEYMRRPCIDGIVNFDPFDLDGYISLMSHGSYPTWLYFYKMPVKLVVKDTTDLYALDAPIYNRVINLTSASNGYNRDVLSPYNNTYPTLGIGPSFDFDGNNWIKEVQHNPILFIPGVLGTQMFSQSDKLWLDLGHNFTDITDMFMDSLQFNKNLTPSDLNIIIGNVISREILDLGFFKKTVFDYSNGLIESLNSQHYTQGITKDDNLFTFPYDWRYGVTGILGVMGGKNITTVDLLKDKISEIRLQTGSDKVDIIAHSTGGLLIKKYVMDNINDNHVGKVVFVGVPNSGAPDAIKMFLQGGNFTNPFINSLEMKKISQNMPVIYDLSPSQEYYNKKGSYVKVIDEDDFQRTFSQKDLNFEETNNFLTGDHGLNSQAITNAQNLHTADFDNFDLRTAGADLYAIDGCKAATLTKLVEVRIHDSRTGKYLVSYHKPETAQGDGTVPLESSTNLPINQSNKYYALKSNHSKMPSQDGIRQQIVNILSGSKLTIDPKLITQDISQCELNGKAISIYSPLDIDITDQDGNHSGLINGAIQNDIPNASFEIMDDHKFVYLPTDEGQTYTINLKGTGRGTFTLDNESIVNSKVASKEVFSNIPVTTSLLGKVNLGSTTTLSIDNDGNGTIDANLSPSSTVDANQAQDLISPITTASIIGTVGQPNFYRTDVSINLSSTDPVLTGQENQTSGILKTVYKLDNDSSYLTYTNPILVSSEGSHTIRFFSTDKAGNNEQEQVLTFTIDKTVPEAHISFDTSAKKINITGSDDTSSATVETTNTSSIITDGAGNTLTLSISKNVTQSKYATLIIPSFSYSNGIKTNDSTLLRYFWTNNSKTNEYTLLISAIKTPTERLISIYSPILNKTYIVDSNKNDDNADLSLQTTLLLLRKKIKTYDGMVVPHIFTNQGKVTVGY